MLELIIYHVLICSLVINVDMIKYQVKNLPYNRYSWLTTHNSFARVGAKSTTGSMILAPSNQQDSITSQLMVKCLLFLLSYTDTHTHIYICISPYSILHIWIMFTWICAVARDVGVWGMVASVSAVVIHFCCF